MQAEEKPQQAAPMASVSSRLSQALTCRCCCFTKQKKDEVAAEWDSEHGQEGGSGDHFDVTVEDPAQAGSVEDEWEKVWSVSIPRSTGSMRYTIGGNLESLAEVGPLVMTLNSRDSTLGVETQESINSINAACTPSPVKSVESGIFSMPSGDISRPSLLLPSMGKTSFMQAEAVPDIGANDFWHDEPVYTKNLPGVTMKRLQKIFRAEPFLIEEALEKDIKAYDMTVSKWQAGVNAPGDHDPEVRRLQDLRPHALPAGGACLDLPNRQRRLRCVRSHPPPGDQHLHTYSRGRRRRGDVPQVGCRGLGEGVALGAAFSEGHRGWSHHASRQRVVRHLVGVDLGAREVALILLQAGESPRLFSLPRMVSVIGHRPVFLCSDVFY